MRRIPGATSGSEPDEWSAYRNVSTGKANGFSLDEMRSMSVQQFMSVNNLMCGEPDRTKDDYDDGGESRFFS